jgi:hypothetical protein
VPEGPIKLAALLKDVADKPENSATSLGLFNLVQDTDSPHQKQWRGILVGVSVAITMAVALGLLIHFISDLRLSAPRRQTADSPIQTKESSRLQSSELTPSGLGLDAFSKPVQELMKYVQCLGKNQCSFSAGITGEEAARQFGYSRLFASAYEEMILQVKSKEGKEQGIRLGDVIRGFEQIVQQEQAIDQMLMRNERHAAAIAYLRALQNGDVVFPGPQPLAPVPQVLLSQLMTAYPNIKLDANDPVFASTYRQTRDFAALRMKVADEVWAQEIIAEFRYLIIHPGEP